MNKLVLALVATVQEEICQAVTTPAVGPHSGLYR